jgi:predicted ArsR family transcriptional regulator
MGGESVIAVCPNCEHSFEAGRIVLGESRLNRGCAPARIVDLLETDAPLTIRQMAAALKLDERAVSKAIWRLDKGGSVVKTQRPEWQPNTPTPRYVWRLA